MKWPSLKRLLTGRREQPPRAARPPTLAEHGAGVGELVEMIREAKQELAAESRAKDEEIRRLKRELESERLKFKLYEQQMEKFRR